MKTLSVIQERHIPGLLRALRDHYRGMPITKAFQGDDTPPRSTYYTLKKNFPNQMAEIEEQARQEALSDFDRAVTAFDAEQFTESTDLQRQARNLLSDALPRLGEIARGATFQASWEDDDGEVKTKTVVTYPRDQIEAARLLQDIAARGVNTNLSKYRRLVEKAMMAEEKGVERPPLLSPLGINTNFSSLSATTPDGRSIHVEVKPSTIIDVDEED